MLIQYMTCVSRDVIVAQGLYIVWQVKNAVDAVQHVFPLLAPLDITSDQLELKGAWAQVVVLHRGSTVPSLDDARVRGQWPKLGTHPCFGHLGCRRCEGRRIKLSSWVGWTPDARRFFFGQLRHKSETGPPNNVHGRAKFAKSSYIPRYNHPTVAQECTIKILAINVTFV